MALVEQHGRRDPVPMKHARRRSHCLVAPALLLAVGTGWGATPDTGGWMPVEAAAGRVYRRTDHGADGTVLAVSRIEVGALEELPGGRAAVNVRLQSAAPEGGWQSAETFRWVCEPGAVDMLVNVFALAGSGPAGPIRAGVRLSVEGPMLRYPRTPRPGADLDAVRFHVRAGRGLASLFGRHTEVRVSDRQVQATDPPDRDSYVLTSDVLAVVSWLGIPLRRSRLRSREVIAAGGVVRQRLTLSEGGFTIIEALAEGALEESAS